jgi:hypothetical protein
MKTTVSKQHFIDAFLTSSYRDNFSYDGLEILFDYLEQSENDCDAELEFDLVAIACDFSESRVADIASDYGIDIDDSMTDEEIIDTVRDYLQDNTQVCGEYEEDGITYFIYCSSF